jgi:ribonuclease PH
VQVVRDDGALLAASINGAVLALLDAGMTKHDLELPPSPLLLSIVFT